MTGEVKVSRKGSDHEGRHEGMLDFDIRRYISAYVEQLNFTLTRSTNYNIYTNFDASIAILTNTVVYKDLPLDVIEKFENSINWDDERNEDEEYEQPFITHLNLNDKVFITSFLDNDLNKIDDAAYGIQFMNDIAQRYGYIYKIVINKEIPKVLNVCKRLRFDTNNIIVVSEESIKTILMINQTYRMNDVISGGDSVANVDNKSGDGKAADVNGDGKAADVNTDSKADDISVDGKTADTNVNVEQSVNPNTDTSDNSSISAHVDKPITSTQPLAPTSNTIKLRDYQLKYIEYMNGNNRSILKLPCGMGKSLIMIYHTMLHKQHSVILVPNISLVDQFKNNIVKFYTSFGVEMPEIHKLSTKDKEVDIKDINKQQIIVSVYNSFVNMFIKPLLTKSLRKSKRERKSERKSERKGDSDIACEPEPNTSITEGLTCISPDAKSILEFNYFPYIYIDEAHHIILPSNKKQLLNVEHLLELYDTEADTNKDIHTNPDFVDAIHSMPNLSLAFSNLLYIFSQTLCLHSVFFSATINPSNFSLYNMFSGIKDGYLCKLNIDIVIDENYSRLQINKTEKISTFALYLSKSPYQSIIVYTTRVQTAKDIQKKLPFRSAVITGSMSSSTRQQCFRDFTEHKIRALLTVNCISEGVDLPCADTAVFFDDKKSIINIIQCVGRVMRNYPGKLSSTLVIPAYNDDDIDNIYQNILAIVNGELGYGSADIRRSVRVKFNTVTKHKRQEIKNKVFHKVYEYNEGYFNKISLNSKISLCTYFYTLKKCVPGLDISLKDTKLPDGSYFDLQQFVHDNLYLDNEAGRRLRKIYGIKLSKDKDDDKVEEVSS